MAIVLSIYVGGADALGEIAEAIHSMTGVLEGRLNSEKGNTTPGALSLSIIPSALIRV